MMIHIMSTALHTFFCNVVDICFVTVQNHEQKFHKVITNKSYNDKDGV